MIIVDTNTRIDRVAHRPELRRVRWRPSTAHTWTVIGYVVNQGNWLWRHSEGRGLAGLQRQGPTRQGPGLAALDLVAKARAAREAGLARGEAA
jgi:hypothetical protein